MRVILQQDVKGVGKLGDVKEVSEGYARNFLLKNNIAIIASDKEMLKISTNIKKKEKTKNKLKQQQSEVLNVLSNKTIKLSSKVTPENKLYAAISAKQIAEKIKSSFSLIVKPSNIIISKPIKELGNHNVKIKFSNNKDTKLTIIVQKIPKNLN